MRSSKTIASFCAVGVATALVVWIVGHLSSLQRAPAAAEPALGVENPHIESGFYEVRNVINHTQLDPVKRGDEFMSDLVYLSQRERFDWKTKRFYTGLKGIYGWQPKYEGEFHNELRPDGSFRQSFSVNPPSLTDSRFSGEYKIFTSKLNGKPAFLLRLTFLSGKEHEYVLAFKGHQHPRVKTLYIAHRGGAVIFPKTVYSPYPANTMPAFEEAIASGYNGFEFDLQLTRDRQLVVSHDDGLGLTTNCKGSVSEKTWDQLRGCRVNASTIVPGLSSVNSLLSAPLPHLHEVLSKYLPDDRVSALVLDIKTLRKNLLIEALNDALVDVRDRSLYRKLVFLAHDKTQLSLLRQNFPGALYALEGDLGVEPQYHYDRYIPGLAKNNPVNNAVSFKINPIFRIPPMSLFIDPFLKEAHARGYPIVAWTVNDPDDVEDYLNDYPFLDFVLSDQPIEKLIRVIIDR